MDDAGMLDASSRGTFTASVMDCTIRPLVSGDEPFLWEMLYQALHVPEGQSPPPREVVRFPELARYVQGWGREGDCGFLASDAITVRPLGAVWLRRLTGENGGYGYVDDATPELSIAVLPGYRGRGIGTQLLRHLFTSDCGRTPISLSVSADNPALRLYGRFAFGVVREGEGSLTMKRDPRPTTASGPGCPDPGGAAAGGRGGDPTG